MTEATEWSDDARSQLITGGRRLAEAVLIHIEALERLRGDDQVEQAEESILELGRALDRFEDVQLDYCGLGLPYLDLTDVGLYDEDDDEDEEETIRPATSVEHISVIARIDLEVTDHDRIRSAATDAGRELGSGAPEHLGEALYNLAAIGGIDQLMQTPGLRPQASLTLFTEQDAPMSAEDIEEANLPELFDLADAPVLFAASDVWDDQGNPENN